jgi:E3 ubiquitin-protein ligase SHPRH
LEAEEETNSLLEDIKSAIAQHDTKGKLLKSEAAVLRGNQGADDEVTDELTRSIEDEWDPEISGLPKTPAGKAHKDKRIGLRNRLREVLMILHRVKFFQGDVYHVLGGSKAVDEDVAYSAAEKIRRDLLSCK